MTRRRARGMLLLRVAAEEVMPVGGCDARASMDAVGERVDKQREVVAERWLARLTEVVPDKTISRTDALDSLLIVLGELADRLRAHGSDEAARPCLRGAELARIHGEQRYGLGFSDEAIVREYQILREVLLTTLVDGGLTPDLDTVLVLTSYVDMMLANAIHAHATCRERALNEEAAAGLRESERRLKQLFSMMPFYAALARGPDHQIELLTEPLKALWGGRDVTGRHHHEAYPELGREHFDVWDRVYATGEPFRAYNMEARVDTGNGAPEVRYFDLSLLPRRDRHGCVEGVGAFAFDVTDRMAKEADLQRRSAYEQQLLGIVSHDLRNPLSAITYGTQTVLRRSDLPDAAVRTLLRVQSSADRAVRLVRDLLDFTQARLGGGIQVKRERVDMHDLAARVVEELQMSHPQRQIDLRPKGHARGCWDPDRMSQIIGNLLSNALKYSPDDTAVTVCTIGHDDTVAVSIHNWGPPIPAEAGARLFEPMERGEETRDVGRSIGLGLFIVKHLAEAHRGHVRFESTMDAGTTFTVRVPKEEPQQA